MSVVVQKMTKEEVETMLKNHEPNRILPPEIKEKLIERGWVMKDEYYCIEKEYKGYKLVIEFCIGDFCTYIGSKNEGYLLEAKIPKDTFVEALIQQEIINTARIDGGETWLGEND